MAVDLPGACIADERAAGTGDVRPVHPRRFVGLGLVPAQQDDHVARFGIGQRHTRVSGPGDRQRALPSTTSKGIRCSCRKTASLPPLSKTNGSPHFSRTTTLPSRALSASR